MRIVQNNCILNFFVILGFRTENDPVRYDPVYCGRSKNVRWIVNRKIAVLIVTPYKNSEPQCLAHLDAVLGEARQKLLF